MPILLTESEYRVLVAQAMRHLANAIEKGQALPAGIEIEPVGVEYRRITIVIETHGSIDEGGAGAALLERTVQAARINKLPPPERETT